jgi:hypothetical protein
MTMWPVSTRVNTPRNDDEDLIRAIQLELPDEPAAHEPLRTANETGSDRGPVNSV